MTPLRPLLSAILMLAVALTSLGMAMGRGAMAADGQLCSVTAAPQIVLAHDGLPLLDAAGEPVTLDHPVCLDCTLGALAFAAAQPLGRSVEADAQTLTPQAYSTDISAFWRMGGHGRGPPVSA